MKIDFHTHCFPDRLAERALSEISGRSAIKPFFDGTFDGLKARLRDAGIDASVICNIATNVKQVPAVNDFAISCNRDGFFPFGSVHPLYEDYKGEIDRLCAAGIRGLKFHPDYQNFFVDDGSIYPIYEYAANKGMVMIFHTGLDIGLKGVVKCTPDRFLNVAEAFRGAKLVAAHMAGFPYADLTEILLAGKDFYMDTSAYLRKLPKTKAEALIKKHGADKILFATDLPWFSPEEDIAFINSLDLPAEDRERIYHQNAKRLLGA